MRFHFAFWLCLLCVDAGQAADPAPPSKTLSQEEHLKLAQEHLRSLGLNDDADRIARLTQGKSQTPVERLAEARMSLDRTLEEIRQLEEETGFPQGIELRVRCVEVATADLNTLRLKDSPGEQSLILNASRAAELIRQLDGLQKSGKAKTLTETSLLTRNGRPATMESGGRFPFAVPAEAGKVIVQYVDFGNRIESMAAMLEPRRVRVDMAFESTERDGSHGAEIGGQVVPGVRRCRLNTQFEAGFGETAMWLIDIPLMDSAASSESPLPDRKSVPNALDAAGLDSSTRAADRPVPRTAILLVRPERVVVPGTPAIP